MKAAFFTESEVERVALDWLAGLGYEVKHGPTIAPGELAERSDFAQVISDGILARIGTVTAGRDWSKRLRTNPGWGAAA